MITGNYFSKSYYIVIFTHREHVYIVDDYLKRTGMYKHSIVPTPCGIKKGCSSSLKVSNIKDIMIIKDAADNLKTPIDSIFNVYKRDKGSKRIIKEIKNII